MRTPHRSTPNVSRPRPKLRSGAGIGPVLAGGFPDLDGGGVALDAAAAAGAAGAADAEEEEEEEEAVPVVVGVGYPAC